MLFKAADAGSPVRLQGTYVSDAEIERIVSHWRRQGVGQYVQELVEAPAWAPKDEKTDDLYERAVQLARHHHGRVSTSLLQRRLRIGYPRAARLMEEMQENGALDSIEAGDPPGGDGTEEPSNEAKGA